MNKDKILVTGITGFVGSHMANFILKNHDDVEIHGTKRYHLSRLEKAQYIFHKVEWHDCDLTDYFAVEDLIDNIRPDKIFHFAAQSFVSPSWKHPTLYMNVNYNCTVNLLEALKKIESKAFFLIPGSAEEYGELEEDQMPINENSPLKPVNPYAVTKIAQDLIGHVYHKSYGLNVIRCRTFNHEGAGRENVFGISSYAYQIAKIEKDLQEPNILVGHLDDRRNFTHVKDVVRAYWMAIDKCIPGELYLIGNEDKDSIFSFKEALEKLKKMSTIPNISHSEHKPYVRPTAVPRLIANTSKFREICDWKPEITFDEILLDTLNYWRREIENKIATGVYK